MATAVAQRKSEFGLLICTTGVGMSMSANKVPGVRAALVSDPETAARARQLLRRLEEADRLQRRVKFLAMKAVVALREMRSVAAPKLESMYAGDRDRWQAEMRSIEVILLKISKLGV